MNLTQNLNYSFTMENHTYHILMITHGIIHKTIPAHYHSNNSYEVHFISEGLGKLIANDAVYALTPGTIFITGPGIMHQQEPDPSDPMREDCLYFYIEDSGASMKASPLTEMFRSNPFWIGQDQQNLSAILQMIHQELPFKAIGHSISINACFQRYLVALARNMTSDSLSENKEYRPFWLEIESAFLYHYRDLTLDHICSIVGMCRRQTQRILLKYYGLNFQKKRTAARMSAAATFLRSNTYKLEEIADLTGYSSISSFLQAFKAYYHMTIREYRKIPCE